MTNYPYQDATLPVQQRVDDLLARMSLEEKVSVLHPHSNPRSGRCST